MLQSCRNVYNYGIMCIFNTCCNIVVLRLLHYAGLVNEIQSGNIGKFKITARVLNKHSYVCSKDIERPPTQLNDTSTVMSVPEISSAVEPS